MEQEASPSRQAQRLSAERTATPEPLRSTGASKGRIDTRFASSSAFTVGASGTLSLNNFNNTIRSLAGSGNVTLGSATLTIDNGSGLTFSGNISGTGGLTLTGNLTLSGTNGYSGPTAINGGSLLAGSTQAFGTSALTVANGATLNFQTFANTIGSITNSGNVASSATISATAFTQNSGGTTTFNFPMNAAAPVGNVTTTASINLNGTLVVTNTGMFTPSSATQVILFQSSGTGKQLHGIFSSTTLPFGKLTYDYSENRIILGASANCDGDWTSDSNGNWDTMANWSSCVPGIGGMAANQDTATFPTVAASSVTVTLANSAGTIAQNVTLHDLTFDSSLTSYTIENFSGMGTIFLDGPPMSTKPTITVFQGDHTINTTISLEQDSRFTLNAGSLTLGPESSIISTGTWNVSEGAGSGTLNNYGTLSPANLLLEGNVIENNGTISPTGASEISGLGGISNPVTVNNHSTLSAGTTFTIGNAAGPTTFNNYAMATATTTFNIVTGIVTNYSGATMAAGSGSTFTVSGGIVTNNAGATLGSSNANIALSAGTLTTAGSVLADDYIQSSSGTLQTNILSLTSFGKVTAAGTATLDGNLVVNALPGISLTNGDTIELLDATGGRTGQFAHVSFTNFPGSLIPSIVYLPDGVQLDVRKANPAPVHGSTINLVFTSIGQHNAFITQKTSQMRKRIHFSNAPLVAASSLSFDEHLLTASNDEQLLPIADSLAQQLNSETFQKTEQLSERVAQGKEHPYNVYLGPVASFGNVDSKKDQAGLGYVTAGVLAGVDGILEDREERSAWAGFGALIEYRKSWGTADNNWGTSTFDRLHGSFYGTIVPKKAPDLAFEAIVGCAYNWDKTKRKTGINQELTAIGKTHEVAADTLFGIEYTLSGRRHSWLPANFSFVPLATLQYVIDFIDGYTETGAGIYDLQVASHTPDSLTSVLGARFNYLFHPGSSTLRAELDLGWQYEYLDRSLSIGLNAINSTALPTTITTESPGRNSLLVALDLLTTTKHGWQVELNASYQLNSLFYDTFFYLGFGREY